MSGIDQAVPGLQGQPVIRQYPGGASNLTYRVDYGPRSFVLRRPQRPGR